MKESIKLSEVRRFIRSEVRKALQEKWDKDVEINPTGKHADKTVEQLKNEIEALRGKPGNRKKMSELLFALRAKQGFKSGKGATGLSKNKK